MALGNEIFKSLSGSELRAVFGNMKFADIQMIKYATSRQKAPIYTMGSADLRAIARGPRSINGALIFSHLSRKNLVEKMAEAGYQVFLSNDESANYNKEFKQKGFDPTTPEGQLQRQALRAGGTIAKTGVIGAGDTFDPFAVGQDLNDLSSFGSVQPAFLADQLPPFDITLVGIPETSGELMSQNAIDAYKPQSLILRGVEFVSEASGTSIEDLVIEKQMSFLARSLQDWSVTTY